MSTEAADIVRALVELSAKHPHGERLLRDVRDLLGKHVHDAEKTITVTLVTPSGNEPQLAANVQTLVEKKYGRKSDVTQRANPALLGGAVLQIGDEQIDLSVLGSLHDMDAKLRVSPVAS